MSAKRSGRRPLCTPGAIALLAVLAVSIAAHGAYAAPVGSLDYFEGSVTLIGDTEILEESDLYFGVPVSPGEVLETAEDGNAEVVFDRTDGSVVQIGPSTAYSVNSDGTPERRRNTVDLFYGRMSLESGDGSADLRVRNGSSVAGVRGTKFEVATAADGAVLVHVESGEVDVENGGNREVGSPGQSVEISPSGSLTGLTLTENQRDGFVDQWINLRNEAFRGNPSFFLRGYANRLEEEYRGFANAARDLLQYKDDLEEAAGSSSSSMGSTAMLRARVAPAVTSVRSHYFLFEESFASVVQLVRILEEQEGSSDLSRELERFLDYFESNRREMLQMIGNTRYMLSLYDQADFEIMSGSMF
ncbi:MAG: FecR family protein [bacterium]